MKGYSVWGLASICLAVGCASAREPPRVELPVRVSPAGMAPVETDLGYLVTLSSARLVLDDLQLSIAGEASTARSWPRALDLLIPSAWAHPGHFEGGDVTGELPGHFLLDLLDGEGPPLGTATLIVGRYHSGNFTFGQAGAQDGLAAGDALLGHSAMFEGEASRAGRRVAFSIVLDAPPGRQLVGAPFEVEVTESSPSGLGFELWTRDLLEGDTLFDGIDFDALALIAGSASEADGLAITVSLQPDSADPLLGSAYDMLRRTFQTHDHFRLSAAQSE